MSHVWVLCMDKTPLGDLAPQECGCPGLPMLDLKKKCSSLTKAYEHLHRFYTLSIFIMDQDATIQSMHKIRLIKTPWTHISKYPC